MQLQLRPGGHVLPGNVNILLLHQLLDMLHECNPFINLYRTTHEQLQLAIARLPGDQVRILLNPRMELVMEFGVDARPHNIPTTNTV